MTFDDHKREAVEYISKLASELDNLQNMEIDKAIDILNAIKVHCQYAIRVLETEDFS